MFNKFEKFYKAYMYNGKMFLLSLLVYILYVMIFDKTACNKPYVFTTIHILVMAVVIGWSHFISGREFSDREKKFYQIVIFMLLFVTLYQQFYTEALEAIDDISDLAKYFVKKLM